MDKKREQGPRGVVRLVKYIPSNLEARGLVSNTVCKLDMVIWCDCITIIEIILALVYWLESRSLIAYTGLKLYTDKDCLEQDPLCLHLQHAEMPGVCLHHWLQHTVITRGTTLLYCTVKIHLHKIQSYLELLFAMFTATELGNSWNK